MTARTLQGFSAAVIVTMLTIAGCAGWRGDVERIVDVASGRTVSRAELLTVLRASDFVLLGEQHDNQYHHERRGELLAALASGAVPAIVAEQLERGRRVQFGPDLQAALVAAGFDAKGWQWPIHEPLFGAVARAGLPLSGANVPRELARQVARSGAAALPVELAAVIDAAPLAPAAQAALDDDLVAGHCGMLPASRLGGMRAAQRARDAAMWLALTEAGTRPSALLAGNGHVRADFGVPQIAAALRPQARVTSVGFLEFGAATAAAPYTFVWVTAPADRGDPCAGMPRIAPVAATPPSPVSTPPPAAR